MISAAKCGWSIVYQPQIFSTLVHRRRSRVFVEREAAIRRCEGGQSLSQRSIDVLRGTFTERSPRRVTTAHNASDDEST